MSSEKLREQKEIAFYWLAKYLYQRELLRAKTFLYFPCKVYEAEIIRRYSSLNTVIAELFEYNKKSIAKIGSHYASQSEYKVFCDSLPAVEFEMFKTKIKNDNLRKRLINTSWDFSLSVIDAITIAYEPWYEQHEKFAKKYKKEKNTK